MVVIYNLGASLPHKHLRQVAHRFQYTNYNSKQHSITMRTFIAYMLMGVGGVLGSATVNW